MAGRRSTGGKRQVMTWDSGSHRAAEVDVTMDDETTDNPLSQGTDSEKDWSFLWKDADLDNNGTLSQSEVKQMFKVASDKGKFFINGENTKLTPMQIHGLWKQMRVGKAMEATYENFMKVVKDPQNAAIFNAVYQQHLDHDWELMWDTGDKDGNGTLSKEEVLTMFETANHLDHVAASNRIITPEIQTRLWLEMCTESEVSPDGGEVSKEAFLSSVHHNPSIYGIVDEATLEARKRNSVINDSVGVGSAVTLFVLCYTSVATKSLQPLFCFKERDCYNHRFGELKEWLEASPERAAVDCAAGGEFWGIWFLGLLICLGFLVGLPIYLCFHVYMGMAVGLDGKEGWLFPDDRLDFRLKFSWLTKRYRKNVWWWEFKIILHKFVVCLIGVALMYNETNIGGALIGIQMASFSAHVFFLPFPNPRNLDKPDAKMNGIEAGLQFVQIVNAIVAKHLANSTNELSSFAENSIIALNAVPFLMLLPALILASRNLQAEVEKNEAIMRVVNMVEEVVEFVEETVEDTVLTAVDVVENAVLEVVDLAEDVADDLEDAFKSAANKERAPDHKHKHISHVARAKTLRAIKQEEEKKSEEEKPTGDKKLAHRHGWMIILKYMALSVPFVIANFTLLFAALGMPITQRDEVPPSGQSCPTGWGSPGFLACDTKFTHNNITAASSWIYDVDNDGSNAKCESFQWLNSMTKEGCSGLYEIVATAETCTECTPGYVRVGGAADSCQECAGSTLVWASFFCTLAYFVPIVSYFLNAFQKWMSLMERPGEEPAEGEDRFEYEIAVAQERELRNIALAATLWNHIQIVQVQFYIRSIPWPSNLMDTIDVLTWPVYFDFTFFSSKITNFCWYQIAGPKTQMSLLVVVPVLTCGCAYVLGYLPARDIRKRGDHSKHTHGNYMDDYRKAHQDSHQPEIHVMKLDATRVAYIKTVVGIALFGICYSLLMVACGRDVLPSTLAMCGSPMETP